MHPPYFLLGSSIINQTPGLILQLRLTIQPYQRRNYHKTSLQVVQNLVEAEDMAVEKIADYEGIVRTCGGRCIEIVIGIAAVDPSMEFVAAADGCFSGFSRAGELLEGRLGERNGILTAVLLCLSTNPVYSCPVYE